MLRIADFNTFYSPQGGGVRHYLERKLEFFSQRQDVSYTLIVPGPANRIEVIESLEHEVRAINRNYQAMLAGREPTR